MRNLLFLLLCVVTLSACAPMTRQSVHQTSVITTSHPTSPDVPVVKDNNLVKAPVASSTRPPVAIQPLSAEDVTCMALTLYHEARGEGDRGMFAVGYVVMNRVDDKRFPPSVCKVIYQGKRVHGRLVHNRCQFNWACDGRSDVPKNKEMYKHCEELAKLVLLKFAPNPVGKSIFYHEVRYHPRWARHSRFVARVGHQLFYKSI